LEQPERYSCKGRPKTVSLQDNSCRRKLKSSPTGTFYKSSLTGATYWSSFKGVALLEQPTEEPHRAASKSSFTE